MGSKVKGAWAVHGESGGDEEGDREEEGMLGDRVSDTHETRLVAESSAEPGRSMARSTMVMGTM